MMPESSRTRAALTAAFGACLLAFALSGVCGRLACAYLLLPSTLPAPPSGAAPLRMALLGAAKVAPHAFLFPATRLAKTVSVVAVGSSTADRARRLAQRWGVPRHGTYDDVLADRGVDAVYIALINGAHHKWAAAALRAGKHVLCEKPLTSNADEARHLERLARRRRLVLMEAYHNLHHPLATRLRELVRGGELGRLQHVTITSGMPAPALLFPRAMRRLLPPSTYRVAATLGLLPTRRDPKMNASLGGGRFLSQGCYAVSMARFLFGGASARVVASTMIEDVPHSAADIATSATLRFEGGGTAEVSHSSLLPSGFNLEATLSGGTLSVTNYLFPHIYHHLRVAPAHGPARFEQHYHPPGPSRDSLRGDCPRLVAKHSWGALLGPVHMCESQPPSPPAETTFELQLRAFAAAVQRRSRRHPLRGLSLLSRLPPSASASASASASSAAAAAALDERALTAALADTSAVSATRNMELIDAI